MTRANGKLRVRRAVLGDESTLRELRLQALADSPEAFCSTYERELARTTADWQRWMAPGPTFLLEGGDSLLGDGDRALGLVAGSRDEEDPLAMHLMAMWVSPSLRGTGAANKLVDAVVAWAASEGARRVVLDVIATNTRARRLYERCGFRATGQEKAREGECRVEVRMERSVAQDERSDAEGARTTG